MSRCRPPCGTRRSSGPSSFRSRSQWDGSTGWSRRCSPSRCSSRRRTTTRSGSCSTPRTSWSLLVIVLAVRARGRTPTSLDQRTLRAQPGPQYGWPLGLLSVITVTTYVLAGWAIKSRTEASAGSTATCSSTRSRSTDVGRGGQGDPSPLSVPGWSATRGLLPPYHGRRGARRAGCAGSRLLGGRWRNVWVVAAWLFHAGTAAVMGMGLGFPLFGIAFAPFYEIERIPVWLAAHTPARFRPATT